VTELLLVRHGESTWNLAGRIQGQAACPELTARGRIQAARAGTELLGHGVRQLLTSDLDRARQSAEIIGKALGLEAEPTPLLRERHYGVWQGRDSAEAVLAAGALADHEPLPGGESLADVRRRWATLLDELRGEDGPVVLVSHGNLIAEVTGVPRPDNGSVSRVLLG
jgi:broad specificity phosphatase PhoE